MSQTVYLTYASSLTDVCEVNSSFDKGVLRICYPGQNRNKSYIAKDDLERCVKTLPYVPVVGNYIRAEEDFGGHDVGVITSLDGTLRMVNKTQPVGVVPANAKVYFNTVVDQNGNEQEYLFTEVLLWKRQEAYKHIKEEGVISHSMEITVKSGEMIDGIFHIYDFEFTALCLLGKDVEPCFEDSALEVFTTSDFKAQFELMMQDFKESFSLATTSTEDKNSQDDTFTKGGEEDLDNENTNVVTNELAETEVVEPEVFEEAEAAEAGEAPAEPEATEPEAEEPVEPEVEEEPVDEPEEAPADEVGEGEEFTLHGDIYRALYEVLANADRIQDGEWSYMRYFFVDFDPEAGMVYFEDASEDWKLFGCSFEMNGDNAVVDFESKKRMKYTIVEFDEGVQIVSPISMFESAMKDCHEDAEAKYQAQIADMESELAELREFKANIENEASVKAHNEVVAAFTDLVGVEEFSALCDNMMTFDVDELREKCYAIRGKNMTNPTSATFSAHTSMPKFPVESNGIHPEADEYADAPYGGVVEHYLGKA